tara:strand:- start:1419 stop:1991 length:573 start_codon:yes stop_codon:yes gene_type:complete
MVRERGECLNKIIIHFQLEKIKKSKGDFIMKKSILSFVFVLALATVASAAPRFGIIGEQTHGVGLFVTDDAFNAQVTGGTATSETGTTKAYELTTVVAGASYKIALDSVTALTVGVDYTLVSGKSGGVEYDKNNTIALTAGYERALSSNIVLTLQADAYSQATTQLTGAANETKITRIFSNGRVGVAYLF